MHEHQYDYGPDHGPVENDISFEARVHILAQAWEAREELALRSDAFSDFFAWADYVLPLCAEIEEGSSRELSEDDYEMILETWVEVTHLLGVDHHQPFESLAECLAAAV